MTAAYPAQAGPERPTPLARLRAALITPIRAMRQRYLPLLMIYYAYGALGLVAIAEAFWVKDALSFTPAELAAIGVWLTLPWTIKMVFGQLADSVPILGSQRRIYVFIGASLVASGIVLMAGAAGGWIAFANKNVLTERKPIDWRILGGGLVFGAVVLAIGLGGLPFGQELVFLVSLTVIALMLYRIAEDLDEAFRKRIFYAALVIFLYRSAPGVGEGYRWFTIDMLGFDEAFYGTLAQIGAGLALAGAWLFSDVITRKPIAQVLLWLTVIGTVLSLPNIALTLRLDQWTEETLGFGARTIALIDITTESPFAELSMIPALTLVAINAPAGRRATWFALMASLMNVALVAGQLQTKYLNYWFEVGRGAYGDLAALTIVAVIIGFVVPVAGILAFGKRAT